MNIKEIKTLFVAVALGTLMLPSALDAATWSVAKDGHDTSSGSADAPFATIQKAVDAASAGDVIRVSDGTYAPIVCDNVDIRIVGINGPDKTVIDGGGIRRCATLSSWEGGVWGEIDPSCRKTTLVGFTLRNGYQMDSWGEDVESLPCGGGVAGGTLEGCVIEYCSALYGGGAFYSTLKSCVVRDCSADSGMSVGMGGGIYGGDAHSCLIEGNLADGDGGGAQSASLWNCTVTANELSAMWMDCASGLGYTCELASGCIVWGNDGANYSAGGMTRVVASCVCPMPNIAGSNITNDPCFVDATTGDYRLRPDSPCVDAGDNDSVSWSRDVLGNARIVNGVVDIGAYESQRGIDPAVILKKPHDVVFVYDGAAKTACPPAETLSISGVNVASNAGVYVVMVSLSAGSRWSDGTTDTVGVSMTILPRPVTLTSADAMWTYDGQWHNAPEVIVGGDGFVAGEGFETTNMTYVCDVGQYQNEFYYWPMEGTLENNYDVSIRYGTLTVVPSETPPVKPDGGPYTEQIGDYTWSYVVINGEVMLQGRKFDDEIMSLVGDYDVCVVPTPTGCVVVPSVLGGCPVTAIGQGAFAGCYEMTSIKLPDGIVEIGDKAFCGCGMESIVFPASIQKIGNDIFWRSDLPRDIYFEGDAPSVGSYGNVPDSVVTYVRYGSIGWRVDGGVGLPESWLGCDIAYWGEVPIETHTVTFDLGDHGSPTGEVALVQTVTNGCAAVAPTVIPHEGWRFDGWDRDFSCVTNDMTVTALYEEGWTDGVYEVIVDGLTWDVEISDGEAIIRGCEGVLPENLVIPSAIGGCPVVALGESLFDADFRDDVHGIVSVMIPASVRHLENYVFWYCTGLKYVNYEGKWDELEFDDEDGVFEGTPYKNGWGVPFLVIEDDVVVGVDWRLERSDCGCVTNGVLRIPDGVVGIAACALSFIEEFESVEIPAGVKTVGEYAFAWNRGLTSVRIADGGTLVSSTAFNGTGWKLANGGWRVPFVENDGGTLKVTYRSVNEDCTCAVSENGSLVIPDGVSVIPAGAFAEECDKMIVSIFCPTSLATVGSAAFAGCRPYLEKLALTAHGIGVACDAFGTDSEFVARVGISLNEGDLAIEGWQVGETVYPATGNEAFLSGVAGGVARPVVKQMEFGVGQASSFAMPTSMGGGRALLAGVSGLGWSHFNLCEYKGPGSLPDQWCYTRADIVDVEKTEANDEDDYECYSLSALDIAYWGGWIPKDDYPAVDDVADEFRSDGFWWPYDWVEEQGFGYENSIYDSVEYPEGNGLYGINEFITRNLRSGKSLIQLGTWESGHGIVCCGYICDESRDLADAGYLKGLFIVDSDNDMRNNGGGRDAPNRITYCPVVWDWQNGAYSIANIWGLPWDWFNIDHSLWARGVEMIPYEDPVFGFECDGTVVRGYHGELPSEIEIPNGTTGIGEYVFAGCANVEALVLPRSIEQIGYRAFYNCPNLRTIYVAEGDADRIRSLLGMSGLDMNGVRIMPAKPENGVWHYVEFDIGEAGNRIGGGDDVQIVSNRCSAVAPEVSATFGWRFTGWSCDFGCVTNDLHVEAQYCCNVSLVPTNAVEGIAYSGQLMFDGDTAITWSSTTDAYRIESESSSFAVGAGTPLGLTGDDQTCAYDLPFAFSFYGIDYTRVYPSSNGTVFFDAPNNQWSYNSNLFRSHPMIAVQWRDMCNGDVYVDVAADAVTFTWRSQYNAGGVANCAVTLCRDGTIRCTYGSGNVYGGYVGVSAGDGERFTQIALEGVSRANADDVIISPAGLPQWLTLTENGVLSGTPDEQGVFDFNIIASDGAGHAAIVPVSITVTENPNKRPVVAGKSPEGDSVVTAGESNVVYSVEASDPDGCALTYEWRVDGEVVAGATTGVFVVFFDIGERHDVECLVSDGFWTISAGKWRSITSREWFVDAINGSDENDGQSREKAFRSIYRAVDSASDDDIITVLPGDYGESIWDCRKRLLVRGVAGADQTVLHGNFYAAYELPDAIAALRFQGVTLCDGQVVRTTLEDCVVRDMLYGCGDLVLRGCAVFNVPSLSFYQLTAEHCTFFGNVINGAERFVGSDCLIFGNTFEDPALPDTFADPCFVDAGNGDFRLRVGSPAIGAASDGTNLGAYQGEPVAGHVVSCATEGNGLLSGLTFVVQGGGSVTVSATELERPFDHFETNGVWATAERGLVLCDVQGDIAVTAVFDVFDFYVDGVNGDDSNDGLSSDSPKVSIQAAAEEALAGEVIHVADGVYGPIYSVKGGVRIVSDHGAECTIIDGAGQERCANLYAWDGGYGANTNVVLVGFSLVNGFAYDNGGGAMCGTLHDCIVANNSAPNAGGGTCDSVLYNCTIYGNNSGMSGAVYGGSAYDSIIWRNSERPTDYYPSLYRCCTDARYAYHYDGTIGLDPLFVSADDGDFRLMAESPCLNAARDGGNIGWYQGHGVSGCRVAFDPGAHGVISNESIRVQQVENGQSAEDPGIVADFGWRFKGWSSDVSSVASNLNVVAEYASAFVLDATNAMEGVEYVGRLRTVDDDVGNVSFSGMMDVYNVINGSSTFAEAIGTALGLTSDDVACAYDLPFAFSFYGVDYTRVYPCSNGTLFFDGENSAYYYDPTEFQSHPMVAVQWRDMCGGDVYVDERANAVTFTWRSQYNGDGGAANCAVTLCKDGTIRCTYGSGNVYGGYVGVSAGDGEHFVLTASEGASRANADDVLYVPAGMPQWLTLAADGVLSGLPVEAGVFDFTVIASDLSGRMAMVPVSITVVENPNKRPVIAGKLPMEDSVITVGGSNVVYTVFASDPDGGTLTYEWRVDGVVVSDATTGVFVVESEYHSGHTIECLVSDGYWTIVAGRWQSVSHATYYVDIEGGDDANDGLSVGRAKASIQSAIDDALDGDRILVADGTYGPIESNDKAIEIVSLGGAAKCVIDGAGEFRCATLGDSTNTVLVGFTLANGLADAGGGAYGGTLRDCVLTDNEGGDDWYRSIYEYSGGGAYLSVLCNCILKNNSAVCGGGAHSCKLYNCTVVGNRSDYYNGGVWCCSVYNSILRNNRSGMYGDSIGMDEASAYSTCSDVELDAYDAAGNFVADPLFVSANAGDYRLRAGSPCLDAGSNACVVTASDFAGGPRVVNGVVDIGAYEGAINDVIVEFDLGDYGVRMGGGELIQIVTNGHVVVAPQVEARPGWKFEGWEEDFSVIAEDVTVHAEYSPVGLSDGRYTEVVGGYTWSYLVEGGEATVDNNGSCAISPFPEGHLEIPSRLGGNRVTVLGEDAFHIYNNSKLASVKIPEGVREIGDSAFENCSDLMSVVLPSSVRTMGSRAFCNCGKLEVINFPDGLESIDYDAFRDCRSLQTIHIPSTLTSLSGNSTVFSGCSSLAEITVSAGNPAFKAVDNCLLTKDGKTLVRGPSVLSVEIPDGVMEIRFSAFDGCSQLRNVGIPVSVRSIGHWAFDKCELEKVYVAIGDTDRVADMLRFSEANIAGVEFVERDSLTSVVTFVVGEYGIRTGGGELFQVVSNGCTAISPEVEVVWPGFAFDGWDKDFACVTNNMVVTALYSAIPYTITYEDVRGQTNDNPTVYTVTNSVTFKPLNDIDLYWFKAWSPSCVYNGSTGDVTVTAQWTRKTSDILIPGVGTRTVNKGESFEYAFLPQVTGGTQLVCMAWTVWRGDEAVTNGFGPTVVFTVDSELPHTVTPDWGTNYWLSIERPTNGTIAGATNGWYAAGASVELQAVGSANYRLKDWLYDAALGESTGDVTTLIMDSAKKVGVTFELFVFRVTFSAGSHGWRTGGGAMSQMVTNGCAAVSPVITPYAGWRFDGWDKDVSCVTNALSATALYSVIPYTITYEDVRGQTNDNPTAYTVTNSVTFKPLNDIDLYWFKAWSPSRIYSGSTGDVTVTAQWTRKTSDIHIPGVGTRTVNKGDQFEFEIAPQVMGGTQLVCTAWTAKRGEEAVTNGVGTSVAFVAASEFGYDIAVDWQTNYWLAITQPKAYGHIEGGASDWYPAETNITLTAILENDHCRLVEWIGNTNGCECVGTDLHVPMSQARKISAELDCERHIVRFDVGEHGQRTGGGALEQIVDYGASAIPPTIRAENKWVFLGWTGIYTGVTNDVSVAAMYKPAYPDLYVHSISNTASMRSGETAYFAWKVGNVGNPAFTGSMTERIILVSADDPSVSNVLATVKYSGSIPSDGLVDRFHEVAIPLKGLVGKWRVIVETAIGTSVREFGGDNFAESGQVLVIEAVPLPDLDVYALMAGQGPIEPGRTHLFGWSVKNVGQITARAPWTDSVYLESVDGKVDYKLADLLRKDDLDVQANRDFDEYLDIPELLPLAGPVVVKIVSDSANDMVEVNDENCVRSYGIYTVATNLYLSAASDSVKENVSSGIRFTVKRSGPTSAAMMVELAANVEGQVTMPETVTIPAGNASTIFYVKPIDNAVVEGDRTVEITALSGSCNPASFSLNILDDEVPRLTISLDRSSIMEGDGKIVATVTRELVTDEPLTVYLSGVSTSRCTYPSSVVIPAGAASAVFEIVPINDETARRTEDLTLRASASGYTAGSTSYRMEDDDIPGVTLSLTPEEVSEGAGPQAIIATLTRSDPKQIKQPVTILLSASESGQLLLPSSITIPAYTMAARFAIGVIDNGLDDGDREVEITGAVRIESCGCSGQPSNGDVIQGDVRINDNDGPSLSLRADPSTMKEGRENAGWIVLSHNSTLAEDLVVRLSYDVEGEIDVPSEVTIPEGETTVRIPVKTLDDGVEDGGQLVSVYADDPAGVFASGSTWVQVSDQNLPDLIVENVGTSAPSVVGGSAFEVSFDIVNDGFNSRSAPSSYKVYFVTGMSVSLGDAKVVANGNTVGGLPVEGRETVTVSVSAPTTPGNYRIAVVADPDAVVSELDEANNTAWSDSITVEPSYTARVEVRQSVYRPGERVFLDGVATMADGKNPAANVPVEVYVLNSSYRRVYNVTTDVEGRFTAEFLPVTGEGDHYTAGASYPRISATATQCSFDILGLKRTSTSYVEFDLTVGQSKRVNVQIKNQSSIPFTNVSVSHGELPGDFSLDVSVPQSIQAYGNANVSIDVSALVATPADVDGYRKIMLYVTDDKGVTLSFPIYVIVRNPRIVTPDPETPAPYVPQIRLAFSPSRIDRKMTVGETQYVDVELTNKGTDPSGAITVNVPTASWLKLATAKQLPALQPGESTTVTLELHPTEGMTFNSAITGSIQAKESSVGINTLLPFSLTPVSDSTGRIRVSPVDEYTYYQAGAPHVSSATVRVTNPYTGAIVAEGRTDDSGVWISQDLPCGTYSVLVGATQHSSWSGKLSVQPGETNSIEPFLTYNAVSYSFDVQRIEIEDTYEIKLVADFVTSVPKPTVVIDIPSEIPKLNAGESYTFNITAANHGLISALNVRFAFPENFPYSYEFASDVLAEIPAKSSVTVPVKVYVPKPEPKKLMATNKLLAVTPPAGGELAYNPCSYGMMAMFEYLCGAEIRREVARSAALQVSGLACDAAVTAMQYLAESFPILTSWGSGDPVPGGGSGGGGTVVRPTYDDDWLDRLNELPPFSEEYVRANCIMGLRLLNCIAENRLEHFPFVGTLGTVIARYRYGEATDEDVNHAFVQDMLGIVSDAIDDISEEIDDEDVQGVLGLANNRIEEAQDDDACEEAIDYYFNTYRQIAEEELARRRAEREASTNGRRQLGLLDATVETPVDIGNLCPPVVQEDAALACAGILARRAAIEKARYVLGGGSAWQNNAEAICFLAFVDKAVVLAKKRTGQVDGGLVSFADEEVAVLKNVAAQLPGVGEGDVDAFVARWNRTSAYYAEGKFAVSDLDEGDDADFIDLDVINAYQRTMHESIEFLELIGGDDVYEAANGGVQRVRSYLNEKSGEVCARVKLVLDQSVTIAREAFRGTLTVENGNDTTPMRNVRLAVRITDANGVYCNDLFGITEEGVTGFGGSSVLAGDLTLGAKSEGVATVLFVPTVDAAPQVPTLYYFGGTLTYIDPLTGEETSAPLAGVPLLVNPCPRLTLHYFLQQEVFGDDPFTPNTVEPSEPAELALLVVNSGAGAVRNMTVRAAQPEKFTNEKGLAVDFRLSDFEVAGTAVNGAAGGGILTTDLGTIPANGTAQAQWWLTSSLQGRFTGMKAEFTQLNDWGNPKTCLIDSTKLHPLVRSVDADGTGKPDYLVCEEVSDGVADTVYCDDGSVLDVNAATMLTQGFARGRSFDVALTFAADRAGAWYGVADDPGAGRYELVKVMREDGTELPIRNAWLRNRSITEKGAPDYCNKMHLFDVVDGAGVQKYVATFEAVNTDVPAVSSFEGFKDGSIETEVRDSVMVAFAAPIDPASFTVADLTLVRQGQHVNDLSDLEIVALDESNRRFQISGLRSLCTELARYELTVQCANIADPFGNVGYEGRSVVWILTSAESPYILNAEGIPVRKVSAFDSFTLVMSSTVTLESLTTAAMTLNGRAITAAVRAEESDQSGTRFVVSGIEAFQDADGDYELQVDGTSLRTPEGVAGVDAFRVGWTRDTTAPVLSGLTFEKGLDDGMVFTVTYSEPVDGAAPTLANIKLMRDGQSLALPQTAGILQVASGQHAVTGLDSVLGEDGLYELTVDSAGVTDEAGNIASGSKSVSWTVDHTPPAKPTELGVSSEYGSIDTVIQTCVGRMTISGVAPEAGVVVRVFSKYVGGNETLLATPNLSANGSFTAEVTLPEGGGNMTLIVRLTDAAGNSSDTEIKTYFDKVALTAELSGAPEIGVAAETMTLSFSEAVISEDVALAKFSLTRNGESVAFDGVTLIPSDDGKTFALQGLSSLCSVDGDYVLSFAATDVRKRSSGLKSSECAPLSWRYECPDREPPTIVAIRVDGEEARSLYTNGISSVSIEFSESVNIQHLAQNGLIDQALRIELLDADLNVTGMVRVGRSDVVCGADNVAWTLPSGSVGPGSARIVVDAGLVTDLAGNKLAADEYAAVDGLQILDFKSDIIATVDSYAMSTWYDFDGDGLGDLVVGEKTSAGEGKVRVYRNVGSITEPMFSGFTYLKVGGSDLSVAASGCQGAQVAFGDLTGDGNDDLIVGYANGKVEMWHGSATRGTYGDSETLLTGAEATYGSDRAFVCPYDLDGDGKIELVIGGVDGKFRVFRYVSGGVSTESWLTDAAGAQLTVTAGRSTPVLADVNNDGCVDILTGDTSGNVWAFLGNGETWNVTAVLAFDNATAKQSDRSRIGYGDVNGDGIGDLLVGRTNGSVELALGVKTESPAFAFRVKGTYTVTFDLGEYGTLKSGDLVQSIVEDDPAVAPEVTVDDCYIFDGWDVTFDSITGDTVVRAKYTHKPPVTLTVAGVIADAAATASHNNGDYEIVYGDEVTVAVPKSVTNAVEKITECTGWIGTGSVPSSGAAECVKTRMVMNSAITWSWQVAKWWLALGAENGTLSVSSGWQTAGSSVSVTATPADHYVFKHWRGDLDDCTVDGVVATLAMDRKRSVVAEFELAKHKIKIGGGMETTTPPVGEYDYAYGSMATVTVVNAVQYSGATQFVCMGWSAINVEPTSGDGTQAVFRVLGDTEIAWTWQTNVLSLADAVNAPEFDLLTGGAVEWTPEWSEGASDGEHCAFIRNVGNNATAWMQTTVDGPGEVSFAWMCDLASKNTKLQFFVDDVAQGVVSGSSPWTPVHVTVYGEGAHVLKWRLFTGRSGAVATDVGAVDAVTWTPAVPPTLAEALNANLAWKTSGARQWRGVAKDARIGVRENWAVASGLDDDETAAIETRVYGNGLLVFDWGVSCEEEYDWMEVSVDGEVKTYITGETGWTTEAIDIFGEGWHVVRWEYIKDEMDEPELVGDNTAMLDSVLWYSEDVPPEEPEKNATESTPVPVPFAEIDAKYKSYLDAANGDYEAAALAIGKNGCPVWESYVAGLDPDNPDSKFTAKIKIVNGKPIITWEPALNGTNADGTCIKEGVRVYELKGSTNLKAWTVVPNNGEDAFNFFKVEVNMPLK